MIDFITGSKSLRNDTEEIALCRRNMVTYHIFDYNKCTIKSPGLAEGVQNFRESIGLVKAFKLHEVIIDASPATALNRSFYLVSDLANASPSCFTNGVASSNICLIPGNLAGDPVAYENHGDVWMEWPSLMNLDEYAFALRDQNNVVIPAPAAPWTFKVSFFLKHEFIEY